MTGCKNQQAEVNTSESIPTFICPSGYLEGRTCSNLYATYLNVTPGTVIKDSVEIDPKQTLERMWEKKMKKSPSPVVDETGKILLDEYDAGKQTTFKKYTNHITTVVHSVQSDIDWDILQRKLDMKDREMAIAKKIALSFDGKDMAAYILTELMPSAEGKFNRAVLDIMLQTGGQEYVESIPAMGDKKTSFGPYQFTEFALFHIGKQMRGASVVNAAVEEGENKIPGSVAKLRGDDHHRAAYMFAVYNICVLVKSLNKKQLSTLENKWKANRDDLFIYCATAHHLPRIARRAARNWLANGAKKPFENSCGVRILEYAQKTRANLKVV